MGINPLWQEDFFLTLQAFHHQAKLSCAEPYYLINCNEKFFVHLVPLDNLFLPDELIQLQKEYQDKGFFLVHLWEDIWLAKRDQVLSRINSFLGLNKSYHGRKAKVIELNKKQMLSFLTSSHLQGYVKSKYNYGLVDGEEIIAVASFSETRPMKHKGIDYQSAELVRFASKEGITIVGGLSKLIKFFLKQVKVNDLMTYADRDWSLGKGYEKLGFELTTPTAPAELYVHATSLIRYFPHRLPKEIMLAFEAQQTLNFHDFLALNGFIKVFNTGNLKYHLYL